MSLLGSSAVSALTPASPMLYRRSLTKGSHASDLLRVELELPAPNPLATSR